VRDPAVEILPVLTLPEAALDPLHEPEAVQELGLAVAFQMIVELAPVLIEGGLKVTVTTGTASTVRVADFVLLPAVFEHARV
jgi:hypothetical protein